MRAFAGKGISQLSLETRLVYTIFALFSLAALIVSTLLYEDILGLDGGTRAATYYGGTPADPLPAAPAPVLDSSGPMVELPGDAFEVDASARTGLGIRMSARTLLEVTHFHLFTAPIFFLVIAHLFLLCAVARAVKMTVISVSAVSLAAHLAAPAIIWASDGGGAWLMPVSGVLMGATFALMTIWPMFAMWAPRTSRR